MIFLRNTFSCLLLGLCGALTGACSVTPASSGLAPSVWIEAEQTTQTNFLPGAGPAAISPQSPGTSGAAFLTLASRKPSEGEPPFYAVWDFTVAQSGVYRLWAAVSPQDVDWTSPFSLQIDDRPAISLEGRKAAGERYGPPPRNQFEWIDADTVELEAGAHQLRLQTLRPRTSARDGLYHGFADAFLLTAELDYVPHGAFPKYSTQPAWAEVTASMPFEELELSLQLPFYQQRLAASSEGFGDEVRDEVVAKLMARPLPGAQPRDPGRYEFGVHGMEAPFVRKGVDTEKIELAYELLARAGVQSFRTAESCWHRLGAQYDDFTELDYQIDSAGRYGMTQMLTVGYPPAPYRVGRGLSAVRPEYQEMYRDYLKTLLTRYADRGLVRYVELANEVDALNPWWVDSTAEMYVEEMKLVKEAVSRYAPDAQTVAFGATYGRNEAMGGEKGGRRFIREAFDKGIDQYADAYSLHYTWQMSERDFPAFFRREADQRGLARKPLLNSEDGARAHPSDVVKLFARNFLLHDMPRVDYFMSKDWFELGSAMTGSLFDLTWTPKLRLLAYAASVDAIQGRTLLGMAEPVPGVEAYLLQWEQAGEPVGGEYSVVLWNEGAASGETATVGGFPSGAQAIDWRLDSVELADGKLSVGSEPVIVFMDQRPDWSLVRPEQWLQKLDGVTEENIAPIVPL